MRNIFLQLLIINFITLISSFDEISEECQELFDDNIHPSECCKFPSREILKKHREKCKNACESDKTFPIGCCEIDCVYDITGVLKNGNLRKHAVIELYENNLNINGGGKFDRWMEIIEKSVEKCIQAVSKSSAIAVCNVPEYLLNFLDCIDSQNFINCPKFTDSKACNKTREIIRNESECGKKFNDIFIISHRIWNKRE